MNFGAKIRIFLVLFVLISPEFVYSQSKTVRQANKKKQDTELRQKKAYEKARKQSAKDKYNMQTDEAKKRITESHKRAKQNRAKDKQPFIDRLTKRKRKPKNK